MDNIVTQSHAMPADHQEVWYAYFRDQYAASPAIRTYWSENSRWYRPELHAALSSRPLPVWPPEAKRVPPADEGCGSARATLG
jgi:hypothetical protein